MSVSTARPTAHGTAAPHLSRRVRIGLVLCVLLGVSALVPPGSSGPPLAVIVLDVVLGLVAIVGAVVFWRTGNRLANRLAAGALIINAVTTLPAFFVDVAGWIKVLAAVIILLTVVTVVLQLGRPKTSVIG